MPKTRPYTREELQGLRRADLQRLCKTYDIKGANAKTAVLVEELANYFVSPAYLNSPRPRTRAPTRFNVHPRPLHSLPGRIAKSARPATPASPPPRPVALQRSEADVQPPAHLPAASASSQPSTAPTLLSRPNAQTSAGALSTREVSVASATDAAQSTPSSNASEIAVLRQEVGALKDSVAKLQQQDQAFTTMLEAKICERADDLIKHHLASLEQREAALRQREIQLEEAWSSIRSYMSDLLAGRSATGAPSISSMPPLPSQGLTKRKSPSTPDHDSKRSRTGAELEQSPPRTPNTLEATTTLRATPSLPRTPSPSRGSAASSRTPGEDNAPGPQHSGPSPSRALPRRLDAGPASWHSRLDNGRRKVSQAHIDLTTITESELVQQDQGSPNYESPGSSSRFLGPILIHDRSTVTPPALSPSPSISGDNFSYSALPVPPRGRSSLAGRGFTSGRPFVSPGREYMDVALNGLSNPNDSPSALATPTSRTMLGTERYRDTRFGDEPVVPWDTPTVDFGRATPNL